MGRGVCTCNYGGEEGRQGQEEGCQEEDREQGKEEGCQEAHEEAAEGQEEADLEEGVDEEQVGPDRLQEAERPRAEEQVDRRRDESPQGAQDQRLRRLQEGLRVLQGSPQELREVGRCRWRLPRITRCTTTCHF